MSCERSAQTAVLRERRDWLAHRIEAKRKVGWETDWDIRDALTWALRRLAENAEQDGAA